MTRKHSLETPSSSSHSKRSEKMYRKVFTGDLYVHYDLKSVIIIALTWPFQPFLKHSSDKCISILFNAKGRTIAPLFSEWLNPKHCRCHRYSCLWTCGWCKIDFIWWKNYKFILTAVVEHLPARQVHYQWGSTSVAKLVAHLPRRLQDSHVGSIPCSAQIILWFIQPYSRKSKYCIKTDFFRLNWRKHFLAMQHIDSQFMVGLSSQFERLSDSFCSLFSHSQISSRQNPI